MADIYSDRFLRQRRNLILISSIIILIEILGLNFDQINILGNKTEITKPENIDYIIWFIFIYLLLRYCQIFYEIPKLDLYKNYLDNYVREVGKVKSLEIIERSENWEERIKKPNIFEKVEFKVAGIRTPDYNNYIYIYHVNIFYMPNKGQASLPSGLTKEIAIRGFDLLKVKLIATIKASINETLFSEYIFPFCLAAFACLSPFIF